LMDRELPPGRSVEFFVRIEAGTPPERLGTVCVLPRGKFAKMLEPWVARVRRVLRMKPAQPDFLEVWCPDSISMPSQPGSSASNTN
jgi:hypothetical protein